MLPKPANMKITGSERFPDNGLQNFNQGRINSFRLAQDCSVFGEKSDYDAECPTQSAPVMWPKLPPGTAPPNDVDISEGASLLNRSPEKVCFESVTEDCIIKSVIR